MPRACKRYTVGVVAVAGGGTQYVKSYFHLLNNNSKQKVTKTLTRHILCCFFHIYDIDYVKFLAQFDYMGPTSDLMCVRDMVLGH